jgi:hypothetical protein
MKIVADEMGGIKVGCFGEKSKGKVDGRQSSVGGRRSEVNYSIITIEQLNNRTVFISRNPDRAK